MIYINKQSYDSQEVKKFERQSEVISEWDDLSNYIKKDLRSLLLKEQHEKCAYCESEITLENSHIEHIYPQNSYPERRFSYDNVVLSCGKVGAGREYKVDHCGETKENYDPADGFISPIENKNCSECFSYTKDGRIQPNTKNRHTLNTIEKLQLNHPTLKDNRKNAMEPYCIEDITEDERVLLFEKIQDDPDIAYKSAILFILNN